SAASPTSIIYTRSLHDALPILPISESTRNQTIVILCRVMWCKMRFIQGLLSVQVKPLFINKLNYLIRYIKLYALSGFYRLANKEIEEHTSELQSRENLVCRLLL